MDRLDCSDLWDEMDFVDGMDGMGLMVGGCRRNRACTDEHGHTRTDTDGGD